MTFRTRYMLAAAVGLWMAHPLSAQEPARLFVERDRALFLPSELSPNQQLANTIAEHLRQSGQLRNYQIDVAYRNGTAELTGSVADQPQREEALRIVQAIPGVERVLDRLMVVTPDGISQAQARPPVVPAPSTVAPRTTPAAGGEQPVEPMPIFQAPMPGPYDLNPPKMPPYAWPTYAPHNNYSRVAYPELYPHNAWPFIGPPYPFPMVPLGWRKVTLEWENGHWWYKKTAGNHDWWRLRYW